VRQTGSALGVALFGSLLSGPAGFIIGLKVVLMTSAGLALRAIAVVVLGVPRTAS